MNRKTTQGKTPDEIKEDKNRLVINHLTLRKLIGWMGILLPLALFIGSYIWNDGYIEASISNYYYTPLRDVFVVPLAALSLVLFTYNGYDKQDKWITNIAAIFGLITAFIYTAFKHHMTLRGFDLYKVLAPQQFQVVQLDSLPSGPYLIMPSVRSDIYGMIHLVCAALFFLTLAYMSYFQFARTNSPKKRRLFRVCAVIIVVTILALVPCFLGLEDFYNSHKLIFIGEAICLVAFGTSWLVKGELIMKEPS